jgi:phosphoglycolate phosphatase
MRVDPAPHRHLLIFDFDGTLADSFSAFLACYNRVAKRRGLAAIECERIADYRSMPPRELMRSLGIGWPQLPALLVAMRREISLDPEPATLFEGTTALLVALRRHGVRTAIVSSNSRRHIERARGNKYAAMIDHYACGASLFGKARKLRDVLRAAKVPASAAVYVGDEVRDAQAAVEAGIDFVAVEWGFTPAALLESHSRLAPLQSFEPLLSWALTSAE